MSETMKIEFSRESHKTRKLLERIPDDKLQWRPHPKSFSAGGLAGHLVGCVRWTDAIFDGDEFDLDPATFESFEPRSVAHLLETFDADVARCKKTLAAAADEAFARPWRLKFKGKQIWEKPRAAVFRDFTLSHMIHHRGQLSVYLRLLEVPVPGTFGPSADEQ